MSSEGEVLKRQIRHSGLSQQEAAEKLGISRQTLSSYFNRMLLPENVKSDVKSLLGIAIDYSILGNKNILSEPAEKYDVTMSPAGKIKRKQVLDQFNRIPYYDVDFIAGNSIETVDSGEVQPSYYMNVPIFKDCAAFNCYSDSMQPIIMAGSIIFCTFVQDWPDVLEFGQIYAISLKDNRRFLKYIMRHSAKTDTHFLLKSENTHYDPFEVPKSKIKGVWLVHGWLNKRTQ